MEKQPQDTESRHADKYIVRLPDGMRDRLKDEATKNARTLNAEIVSRLQASFEPTQGVEAQDWGLLVDERLNELRSSSNFAEMRMQRIYIRIFESRVRALEQSDPKGKLEEAQRALVYLKSLARDLEVTRDRLLAETLAISRRQSVNGERLLKKIDKVVERIIKDDDAIQIERQKTIWDIAHSVGVTRGEVRLAEEEDDRYMKELRESRPPFQRDIELHDRIKREADEIGRRYDQPVATEVERGKHQSALRMHTITPPMPQPPATQVFEHESLPKRTHGASDDGFKQAAGFGFVTPPEEPPEKPKRRAAKPDQPRPRK